jgi:tetratricopeptide (TPR) repeat protein
LQAQGDLKGAIACYEKALTFDPEDTNAYLNLGNALAARQDLAGAIACFKKALDLDPKIALAHSDLGTALYEQGDVKGAVACYRKAIDLDPNYAMAHCNLGHALREQGHFAQALKALKRGHQLGSQRPSWRYPSAQWVQDCQRLLDLDARLSAIDKSDAEPQDSAEQLALADLCQRYKQRYVAAARFYQGAFAAQPKLTPAQQAFFRYNAACAATLAAAGKGEDAGKLEAEEKSHLRQQALAWLRDNLKQYVKQLEDAEAKSRTAVQQTLQHWRNNPGLASVRDKEGLAMLPDPERRAWEQFWADVEDLRKRVRETKSK